MRVGRYECSRLLGEGGMGSVHVASHLVTGKRVAIKLLKPEVMAVPGTVERFLTEARAACQVDHPNVVDVLDVEVEDGTPYMVLELLEGESLEDRLLRGPMTPSELWTVAEPLLSALAKAHARGILHRDLKPANVFLSVDAAGRTVPKLLDFGIAKLLDGDDLSLTATGHLVGTPLYMPPEIIGGAKSVRPELDLYSFGAVCYEALAGRAPFAAENLPQLLVAVTHADPTPLETYGVPAGVASVVRRAMARDPDARFGSAAAFARALGDAVDVEHEEATVGDELGFAKTAPSVRPGPLPTRAPRRLGRWIALGLVVVGIGVAGYLHSGAPPVRPEPSAPSEPFSERAAEPPTPPLAVEAPAEEIERLPPPPEVPHEEAAPARRRSRIVPARPRHVVQPASEPLAPEAPADIRSRGGGNVDEAPLRVEGERSGGLSADEF